MSRRQQEIKRIKTALKAKTPHRTFREITFNRDKIRAGIVRLTFDEARRMKGPVYEALKSELYRDGCHMLPEFLHCLAEKEQMLYESVSIRARITDDRPLLYEMIDKLKQAELALLMHKKRGLKECFTHFYEALQLLEPYRQKYEYVLTAVMEKIVSLCHNIEGQERDAAEMISRIYFAYALYLENTAQRVNAIAYFERTLQLVRGHVWSAERGAHTTDKLMLHELVSQKLAQQLLILGKQIVRQQPEEAVEMARKATLLIAEIGREKNLELFCNTFLERAFFMMEWGNYHKGQQILEEVRPRIVPRTEYKFVKLNIRFYVLLGQCAENFNDTERAISNFKKALRLSRLYDHKDFEADTLLTLGKIFAKDTQRTSLAKKCYEQAKNIYIDFNDMHNKKKATYLMAKLMADEITPLYMAMLKASTTRYCAFFNLRQWKNRCRPFWKKLGDEIEKQETNNIYCLLDEENEDASSDTDVYSPEDRKTFKLEEDDT